MNYLRVDFYVQNDRNKKTIKCAPKCTTDILLLNEAILWQKKTTLSC